MPHGTNILSRPVCHYDALARYLDASFVVETPFLIELHVLRKGALIAEALALRRLNVASWACFAIESGGIVLITPRRTWFAGRPRLPDFAREAVRALGDSNFDIVAPGTFSRSFFAVLAGIALPTHSLCYFRGIVGRRTDLAAGCRFLGRFI